MPLEAVQTPPQIPLAEVDEDGDLSNRVVLEMSYLEPIEVKKPWKKALAGSVKPFS